MIGFFADLPEKDVIDWFVDVNWPFNLVFYGISSLVIRIKRTRFEIPSVSISTVEKDFQPVETFWNQFPPGGKGKNP